MIIQFWRAERLVGDELAFTHPMYVLCRDLQVSYLGCLIGLTIWSKDYDDSNFSFQDSSSSRYQPDKMVAYFCMIHVGIWAMVAILDRYAHHVVCVLYIVIVVQSVCVCVSIVIS